MLIPQFASGLVMQPTTKDILAGLGAGTPIAELTARLGWQSHEFTEWWQKQTQSRVPAHVGERRLGLGSIVRIERDAQGIPTIRAESDVDLFFGFGFAIGQDRLFQLDYLRRKATGRLSEVLGAEALASDRLVRTVGIPRRARQQWEELSPQHREFVEAYCRGINAAIQDCHEYLPIEFDLLDYRPEPWTPIDSMAIEVEFQWYLTGRFPVIAIPELAHRALGDGPLYDAFLAAEADRESILQEEDLARFAASGQATFPAGATVSDPQASEGSNNWVISGEHTASGLPLVASDPHIAFAAVSCWHEATLDSPGFKVTGMSYVGMPAIMFGRNANVAWGCTNNICSQRDLYLERTDAAHPGCYLNGDSWTPATSRTESIAVRGQENVTLEVVTTHNGPLVDAILPPPAHETGPVSLRWLGHQHGGWLTALLGMNAAKTAEEFRQATNPWHVPTFCVVYADDAGDIGYQCTGRLPWRDSWRRTYRRGWDPADRWDRLVSFEEMPATQNPPRGYVITANNRVANEFPVPLSGTWSSGHRGRRIRNLVEGAISAGRKLTRFDMARLHQDSLNLRALECVPQLIAWLAPAEDGRVRLAAEVLAGWDCRSEPDRIGATLFNVFFVNWCHTVARERFSEESVPLIATAINGLASNLLVDDSVGWFQSNREFAIVQTFRKTISQLTARLGEDMQEWAWGRLHKLRQPHPLSTRGDLGQLLDRGGVPVRGDGQTVCNTGLDADYGGFMGAGYRLIADLSDVGAGLWAVDAGSQSGHPGSPNYDDQLLDWLTGRYHYLPLRSDETESPKTVLTLT